MHPNPHEAAHRRSPVPVRTWLQPALIGLVIVSAFISCYIGVQRDPQPHRLPISVSGHLLSDELQQALGDSVDVRPAASTADARLALERHDVVAALSATDHGEKLRLEVAGANGLSTTNAVKNLVSAYGHGAGKDVAVRDVVPLDQYDARGLAGFYVSFGVSLAGFVLAQNALGLGQLLHLRHRLSLIAGFSAVSGLLAAFIAGPVLGAVPAPFLPLAFTLALLSGAAAFTTKLLGTYLGPLGVPVATLLLLTIGNSTSGATIGTDLLPGVGRALSTALPPGAAVRAVTDLTYFDGAHALTPLATLALWAGGAALLVVLRPRLSSAVRRLPLRRTAAAV
ncbi:hypothetical protein ACFYXS_14525 [Streptomyces sp. NPDC002574]|uniref:hypothetical protein n=1 Tax=Streptomyces sp. NPDC002574 TaxID=3364652 RepID=UPI0036883EFD